MRMTGHTYEFQIWISFNFLLRHGWFSVESMRGTMSINTSLGMFVFQPAHVPLLFDLFTIRPLLSTSDRSYLTTMPTYEEQKRLAGYDPRVNFSLTQTPVVSSPLPDVGSLNHTAKTWLQRVFKSEQLYVAAECSIRNNEFCSQLARIL